MLFDGGVSLPGEVAAALALRADREIDLDEADPLLLHEVALDGPPVYEEVPGAFEEFRLRAIKRYLDTAWIRRWRRTS